MILMLKDQISKNMKDYISYMWYHHAYRSTVELFMLSHVEKRKKSVVGKSIVLRGQKVV
jgi:hypothetical protein